MSTFEYPAICFRQRQTAKTWFCLISAPVGQILQWARVDRLEPNNMKGVQRKKNDSKARSIRLFFQADEANTIPTTLTIALPIASTNLGEGLSASTSVGTRVEKLIVEIGENEALPGLIIDGQHRIFGINEFDPTTPISAVIVLGADDAEIAFQFLVINNKVSKVSPDHIKALRLGYLEEQLDARLTKSARMKSTGAPTYLETIDTEVDSPFKGRLKWPRNVEPESYKLIPPNAFEASLLYISNQQLSSGSDQEIKSYDFVVDLFLEIWKEIRDNWPNAWEESNSRLLSKLGVTCMSQYLVDSLISRIEASEDIEVVKDLGRVREIIRSILTRQDYLFWTSPWNASSLDTSAGRDMVIKDLRKIAINKRSNNPWDSGLRLVESLE